MRAIHTKQLLWVLTLFVMGMGYQVSAQNHSYYVRAVSQNFDPELSSNGTSLQYNGKDSDLARLFANNTIYVFEKAFSASKKASLQRVFYVETNSSSSLSEFTSENAEIFEFGEYLGVDDTQLLGGTEMISGYSYGKSYNLREVQSQNANYQGPSTNYPNDYGQTGPQGPGNNVGMNLNLSAWDYVGLPRAWSFTTGSALIGISDARVDTLDVEFAGKLTTLNNNVSLANGHGIGVSAIAGAQGDNGEFNVGFCWDCPMVHYRYISTYNGILELSYAGAKAINCSWVQSSYSEMNQEAINEATENGSIVVGGSGNDPWGGTNGTYGNVYKYPASYDNVISVASVGSKYESVVDSVFFSGGYRAYNVKDHVTSTIQFSQDPQGDPNTPYVGLTTATVTMNSKVDILGAGGSYRYGMIYQNLPPDPTYGYYMAFPTSGSAPQVTGTLGLMFSVNECLSFLEAESILKVASTNIDHISANSFAAGKYGSGGLHAGRAVELSWALQNPLATAYLKDQLLNRWDFIFKGVSKDIIMRDITFNGTSTLEVTAKNVIILEDGVLLDPGPSLNGESYMILEIDPSLVLDTDCPVGSGFVESNERVKDEPESMYGVIPTLVDSEMNIVNRISDEALLKTVVIYDLFNQEVFRMENIETVNVVLEVSRLREGIYILKGYSNSEEILTTKFIKK